MIDKLMSSFKTNSLTGSASEKSQFVILGWTKKALPPQLDEFVQANEINYLSWNYGRYGTLFLLNSHPDIASTAEAVAVKLGFAHSESFESLWASDLLGRDLVGAGGVNHKAIRGNALVFCVSQREPAFCIYQSLVSRSQIYYWRDHDTIICSDTLRHLAAIVSPLELNPDAVPRYLLYRTLSGDMTYFKDIYRLLPGHLIKFKAGDWHLEQIERLDDFIPERRFSQVSPKIVAEFDQLAEQVVGSYVKQVTELGHTPGMLLSGGVDSSLLASLIKSNLAPQDRLQSLSYIMRVPSFTDEVKYAQHAIDLLEANHKFVDVYPADYPDLLEQTIDLLARPIGDEQVPCYLALALSLSAQEPRYLFSGTAVDTLLGTRDAKRLLQVEAFRHIPGARLALGFLGKSLKRVLPNKAYGMREIASILPSLSDPLSFHAPVNYNLFTNFETVQQCFDPNTIRRVIEHRRALFELYSDSSSLVEQVHFIDFTHILHDEGVNIAELYQAYALTDVAPFLDTDFIRHALAFEPNVRYYANGRAKWLPKQLVENRLQSQTTKWPKLAGGFDNELFQWMKDGVLRDMVLSIERPGYMSVADFEQKREKPDWFTWSLLILDLFQKRFLKASA